MLRQALILAAGRGRPVADPDMPNCLATVGGMPLLARTLRLLARCGIRRVGVTVGWQGVAGPPAPGGAARGRRRQRGDDAWPAEVQLFDNPDWDRPNGLSVLAARRFITEPTLLLMADQVAAPALIQRFASLPVPDGRTVLGIDRDLSRVFDIDDATKVALASEPRGRLRVARMGKELTEYEAVSTSLFVMAPSLLDALDSLPEPSLTQGVAEAASRGLVDALDVTGSIWQDVDSAEMRLHAEWLLRAYGEELARPNVQGQAQSPATQTLALIERLLAEKDSARYALFNPGPVMTSTRVKAALVHHDVCHRDEDYTGVVRRLQTKLRPVFNASDAHDILLVTGSGTAAMETALLSAVPVPGRQDPDHLATAPSASGWATSSTCTGCRTGGCAWRWGEPMDPAAVAAALRADPQHHHGGDDPARDLGRPAEPGGRGRAAVRRSWTGCWWWTRSRRWGPRSWTSQADGIDVCFSSSNKCLHAVAGVSFLCVSPRLWARTAGSAAARLLPGSGPLPAGDAGAGADAVHPGGVHLLRAGDGAGRAGRAGWGAGPARGVPQAQPAHPPGADQPGLPVVHQHRPRVGDHLDGQGPGRRRRCRRCTTS